MGGDRRMSDDYRRAEDRKQMADRELLIRLDERFESFMDAFEKHINETKEDRKEHDKRISSLETDRAKVWGGATVLSIIGSAVMWIIQHVTLKGT